MLGALVHDLGLGDFEPDLAMLDHAAPWLEEPDASPPAKRRCLVGRRHDSATWFLPSSPEEIEASPSEPEMLSLSPAPFQPDVAGEAQEQPLIGVSSFPAPSATPATSLATHVPPFEVPVTEATDVDCDLSSLPGPLYLIPAIVSGRASLDASPSSLLVYVVSTTPSPSLGTPMPAPRPLASQTNAFRQQDLHKALPYSSPRTSFANWSATADLSSSFT